MIGLQDFQDYVVFHAPCNLLRDALQRNVSFFIHFIRNGQRFLVGEAIPIGMEGLFRAQDHVTRHAVFQLANIARPIALLQQLERFARYGRGVALKTAIKLFEEIFDEIGNVVPALAERRQRDGDHIDAIKKIGAKSATRDFLLQQAVGGTDHSSVQLLFFVIANSGEMAVLKDVKQFCLQTGIEFGNLIQKKCSALRHLDAPGLSRMRPGEGALLESEQLAFDERSRDRRTIYLYERTLIPGRALMNKASQDLFAGAAFAQYQYGNVQTGGALGA